MLIHTYMDLNYIEKFCQIMQVWNNTRISTISSNWFGIHRKKEHLNDIKKLESCLLCSGLWHVWNELLNIKLLGLKCMKCQLICFISLHRTRKSKAAVQDSQCKSQIAINSLPAVLTWIKASTDWWPNARLIHIFRLEFASPFALAVVAVLTFF